MNPNEQAEKWQRKAEQMNVLCNEYADDLEKLGAELHKIEEQLQEARGKLGEYRGLLSSYESDVDQWLRTTGSNYAHRRLAELRAKLKDLDN